MRKGAERAKRICTRVGEADSDVHSMYTTYANDLIELGVS